VGLGRPAALLAQRRVNHEAQGGAEGASAFIGFINESVDSFD